MILAGDIGGTRARLALYEPGSDGPQRVAAQQYHSREYPSLEAVVTQFLTEHSLSVNAACLGIAGPVIDGTVKTPNLPWTVDARRLAGQLSLEKVLLINDLEASAWSLAALSKSDLVALSPGDGIDRAAHRAVIAAGTGLGEAGLFYDGQAHWPLAGEGGHADFSPRTPEETALLARLRGIYGHVSMERVLSGPGLRNIYKFLRDTGFAPESDEVVRLMRQRDPVAVISEYGLNGECALCVRSLNLFVSIYGAAAGNLALRFAALGGVYIGGGIAPRILPKLSEGAFMEAFVDKGRMRPFLEAMPVHVIRVPDAGVLGAARCAARCLVTV